MLYKHGHVPDRFSQPLGSLPSTNGRRAIADPEWHPHHLPLVCLGDPKAPRTDSTSGPMMGVPPGPAILQAMPGCTQVGSLPSANRPNKTPLTQPVRGGWRHVCAQHCSTTLAPLQDARVALSAHLPSLLSRSIFSRARKLGNCKVNSFGRTPKQQLDLSATDAKGASAPTRTPRVHIVATAATSAITQASRRDAASSAPAMRSTMGSQAGRCT